MATSTAATIGVSTPTHRPPGRHTVGSSLRPLEMSGRAGGRAVRRGRASPCLRVRPWGVIESATTPCIRARRCSVSLES
eukprot:6212226-Pleurochrysis_carterae.AAC.1